MWAPLPWSTSCDKYGTAGFGVLQAERSLSWGRRGRGACEVETGSPGMGGAAELGTVWCGQGATSDWGTGRPTPPVSRQSQVRSGGVTVAGQDLRPQCPRCGLSTAVTAPQMAARHPRDSRGLFPENPGRPPPSDGPGHRLRRSRAHSQQGTVWATTPWRVVSGGGGLSPRTSPLTPRKVTVSNTPGPSRRTRPY